MSPFTKHFVHGLDPVTLTAIGLGISAISGAAGVAESVINKPKAPAVPGAPPTPAPQQTPQGSQNSSVPQETPSFLAAATTPQAGQTVGGGSGKTLLGQ